MKDPVTILDNLLHASTGGRAPAGEFLKEDPAGNDDERSEFSGVLTRPEIQRENQP